MLLPLPEIQGPAAHKQPELEKVGPQPSVLQCAAGSVRTCLSHTGKAVCAQTFDCVLHGLDCAKFKDAHHACVSQGSSNMHTMHVCHRGVQKCTVHPLFKLMSKVVGLAYFLDFGW